MLNIDWPCTTDVYNDETESNSKWKAGRVLQQNRTLSVMLNLILECLGSSPAPTTPIQFPADEPWDEAEDESSTWSQPPT